MNRNRCIHVACKILIFVTLLLPAGISAGAQQATGTVTDDSGKPIAGAKLWLVLRHGSGDDENWIVAGESDADGKFSLDAPTEWLKPGPFYQLRNVWCYAAGHQIQAASAYDQLEKDNKEPIEIKLAPATNLTYTVESPTGEPLADVAVEPWYYSASGYPMMPKPLGELLRTTTDADGVARFTSLDPASTNSVRISSDEFGTQNSANTVGSPDASTERSVRLSKVGSLAVKLNGGVKADLAGIKVYAYHDPTRQGTGKAEGYAEATFDDSGNARIEQITAGQVRLRIDLDANVKVRPSYPETIVVKANETTDVQVPLEVAVKVRGQVVTEGEQEPVANALVSLNSQGSFDFRQVMTDAEGWYETYVLPGPLNHSLTRIPKPYQYWARATTSHQPSTIPEGATDFELPPLSIVETHEVTGTLVDSEGKPATGWRIAAVDGNSNRGHATIDDAGKFTMHVPTNANIDYYTAHHNNTHERRATEVTSENPLVIALEPEVPNNVTITTAATPENKLRLQPNSASGPAGGLNVVIAKNVLLLDGAIATWADVSDAVQAADDNSGKTINYRYTQGGAERMEEAQMWMKMLDETADATTGRQSFTHGQLYDSLELGDFWPPESYVSTTGTVTTPSGEPAANVQVALHTPPSGGQQQWMAYWHLIGVLISTQTDTTTVSTDNEGRFELSVPGDEPFALVAIGPDGFRRIVGDSSADSNNIQLEPWARVTAELPKNSKQPQQTSCTASVPAADGLPQLWLSVQRNPQSDKTEYFVPAGFEVQLARMVSGSQGMAANAGRPAKLTPEPGQTTHVKFGPLTESEKKQVARELKRYAKMMNQQDGVVIEVETVAE